MLSTNNRGDFLKVLLSNEDVEILDAVQVAKKLMLRASFLDEYCHQTSCLNHNYTKLSLWRKVADDLAKVDSDTASASARALGGHAGAEPEPTPLDDQLRRRKDIAGTTSTQPSEPQELTLIVYAYYETGDEKASFYRENFEFFLRHSLTADAAADDVDYAIVMNFEMDLFYASHVPPLPNVHVFVRENFCFDSGAWGSALARMRERFPERWMKYTKFIFLNGSVRGPFLPAYVSQMGWPWHRFFTSYLRGNVKLVGCTVNCDPDLHIQSFVWATDRDGLQALWKSAFDLSVVWTAEELQQANIYDEKENLLWNPIPLASDTDPWPYRIYYLGREIENHFSVCAPTKFHAITQELAITRIFLRYKYSFHAMQLSFQNVNWDLFSHPSNKELREQLCRTSAERDTLIQTAESTQDLSTSYKLYGRFPALGLGFSDGIFPAIHELIFMKATDERSLYPVHTALYSYWADNALLRRLFSALSNECTEPQTARLCALPDTLLLALDAWVRDSIASFRYSHYRSSDAAIAMAVWRPPACGALPTASLSKENSVTLSSSDHLQQNKKNKKQQLSWQEWNEQQMLVRQRERESADSDD